MIINQPKQTLKEFMRDRFVLNDMKDGIKIIDAPHLDIFVISWK
jgi:hypothetical protein